jgi:dTDP-4-amino-4,6-dideoxygalactose transaminase
MAGTFGKVSCFSAHPFKNLNALGDSGFLITNNFTVFKKIKHLRNHGMVNSKRVNNFGYVSRMDNLQATILNHRLNNLKNIIKKRRKNFEIYKKSLDRNNIFFPDEEKDQFNTYHTFVIQVKKRDKLRKFLLSKGISTQIHYYIPIHKQPAFKKIYKKKIFLRNTEKQANQILTLPINQFLKPKEIKYIAHSINSFYEKK